MADGFGQLRGVFQVGRAHDIRLFFPGSGRALARRRRTIARARLTIDLGAVVANWRELDAASGPEVETAAVLKADGYGLGAGPVGRALAGAGAQSFFVALAEEGAALRDTLGPGPAIFVFAGLMAGDAKLCQRFQLTPCLNSVAQMNDFIHQCDGLPCAVQVDSGMHRLGLEPAELGSVAHLMPRLAPRLVISHLACADEPGHPQNERQRAAFVALAARVPGARRSLGATGGVLLGPAFHFDMTRPGVGLYGGLPFAGARPVVTLSLPVVQVREVAPGEAVGYGATWVAAGPSRIATVAAGYADGLLRALGGHGMKLWAGNAACPVVGRVSMDLITVDVTGLREVPDALEVLNGVQGVDALAAAAGTIGYEILTGLGARYERVYLGNPQQSGSSA